MCVQRVGPDKRGVLCGEVNRQAGVPRNGVDTFRYAACQQREAEDQLAFGGVGLLFLGGLFLRGVFLLWGILGENNGHGRESERHAEHQSHQFFHCCSSPWRLTNLPVVWAYDTQPHMKRLLTSN